jgi:predicted MFS family arabinose efflux permease
VQTADSPRVEGRLDSARGWLVVGATFLSTFTVFGVAYSFGAFFDSMAKDFHTDKGATALMFSITTALYFTLGMVAGHFADRFGPRPVLITGALSLGVGLLATSRVSSIELGYVTYGVGVGVAVACAYVPMVATVSGWFLRHRAAAVGVAVAGIGMGTLVVAPMSQALIDRYGWRTAYVVLGIGGTGLLLIASLVARRPPAGVQAESAPLASVIRERRFMVFYAAIVLTSLGLFVPFVFVKSYAKERGIDSGAAAALVAIIGGASIVGRVVMGAVASRVGAIRLLQASFAIMAASFLLWLSAGSSYAVLAVFSAVMGIGYGGFVALSPAVAALLFGTTGLGAVLGALYTAAGIGGLVGPPIAGVVIDQASYHVAIVLFLILSSLATVVLFALPRPEPRRI